MLIFSIGFCFFIILFVFILTTQSKTPSPIAQTNNLSITWPEHNTVLNGTHIFEAYLPNKPLGSYDIYWSIDGENIYLLEDSFTEFPHKQGLAKITQWEANDTGIHVIKFIATEKNNPQIILETTSVTVYTDDSHKNNSILEQIASAINASDSQSVDNSLSHVSDSDISVNWPTEGTEDTFDQLFTISIHNVNPSEYYAFWQVGNGAYNKMKPQDGTSIVSSHINFNSWTWKNDGPYDIFFIVQNRDAEEIFRKKISINRYDIEGIEFVATDLTKVATTQTNETDTEDPVVVEEESPTEEPVATNTPVPDSQTETISKDISLDNKSLYVAPNKAREAIEQTDNYVIQTLLEFIAKEPQAIWLTGNTYDTETVSNAIENSDELELPIFVLYNIPNRDCGSYSSGGASDTSSYLQWVDNIINATNESPAIFIIEPDALASSSCLSEADKIKRFELITQTVQKIKENIPSKVYIDIGHPYWLSVTEASSLLDKAGIAYADGFSVNTSNYIKTEENITYGTNILNRLGQHDISFVIDTSRNGNGPTQNNEWCNPSDRALGESPQLLPETNVDAFLWIKRPGESDGTCNGGEKAGAWWLEYALRLITQMIQQQIQYL